MTIPAVIYGRPVQQTVVIPIVFHIIYHLPEQNISEQQILSQLKALDNGFNFPERKYIDPEFLASVASCDFNFGLAAYDPAGNQHAGITRTYTDKKVFGNLDIISSSRGGKDPWDTNRYLNVWICNLGGEVLAFTGSKGQASGFDGIVIDFEAFGTTGTSKWPHHLGKTLIHELGHYLGLTHLEGLTGGCDDDDAINDTPNQNNFYASCREKYSCGSKDMVQNYMSLGDDQCLHFFTKGQKEFMIAFYYDFRPNLIRHIHSEMITQLDLNDLNVSIYPNPTKADVYIDSHFRYYQIYDQAGVLVATGSNQKKERIVSLKNLPDGIYFIKTYCHIKGTTYHKVIKFNGN